MTLLEALARMLIVVVARVKELHGEEFTGRIMIDVVKGTPSKKYYVQTAEKAE